MDIGKLCTVSILAFLCFSVSSLKSSAQTRDEVPDSNFVPPRLGEGLSVGRYAFAKVEKAGRRRLSLDTYRPAESGAETAALPIIVMYFGGGWMNGRPGLFTPLAQALAHRGYVTIVPEYRLSGEAKFPAAVHDCKAAVRWARRNAELLHGDPQRIAVLGGSAGGHLAAFIAATNNNPEFEGTANHLGVSSAVQAAVIMCGVLDFHSEVVMANIEKALNSGGVSTHVEFLGATPTEDPELYKRASPLTHIGKCMPPSLFIDGEFDHPRVRYSKAWEKMDELGIFHEFVMMEQGPHAFWNRDLWFEDTVDAVHRFLAKQLN